MNYRTDIVSFFRGGGALISKILLFGGGGALISKILLFGGGGALIREWALIRSITVINLLIHQF